MTAPDSRIVVLAATTKDGREFAAEQHPTDELVVVLTPRNARRAAVGLSARHFYVTGRAEALPAYERLRMLDQARLVIAGDGCGACRHYIARLIAQLEDAVTELGNREEDSHG